MITPEYLNEVIQNTELAVNKLNNKLLKDVVKHILYAFQTGNELLMPSTIHDLHKIVQSGYSLEEIQNLIEQSMPSIQSEIHQAFLESANEIAQYNYEFTRMMVEYAKINAKMPEYTFENIPRKASELHMTKAEILTLENAYKRTNYTVRNITQSTANSVYQSYFDCCDDAYMRVQAGQSPSKAITDVIDELAQKGCTSVQYPTGHVDKIDVAVARAVRTGINQANSEIILNRASEMGVQYVKVSQHLGARVTKVDDYTNHSWWQGKIYSLDWNNPILAKNIANIPLQDKEFGYLQELKAKLTKEKKHKYPDFVETCGYGTIEGIIGINCRHTFMMWNPDVNINNDEPIDSAENEKRYNNEQKQRAMERQIRRWKGERSALKQIPPNEYSVRKIAELTSKINAGVDSYKKFCDRNNLPYFGDRLGIGVI